MLDATVGSSEVQRQRVLAATGADHESLHAR